MFAVNIVHKIAKTLDLIRLWAGSIMLMGYLFIHLLWINNFISKNLVV